MIDINVWKPEENEIKFINRTDEEGYFVDVPINPIDFEEYDPKKINVWDTYKEVGDEVGRVTRAILKAKFPYLIESEKGQGKTLLIHTICRDNNIPLIEEPVGSGTRRTDLIGSKEINRDGTFFNLGLLPKAIEVANNFGHACLFCDDATAQEHDIQRWWNGICDGRKSIVANGKSFHLNKGSKLAIVWTINPASYAGINTMTEDLRSRFIGNVWDYPKNDEIEKVIDWENCSEELVKTPLLTLVQDIYALRMKGDLEYALSIRDIAQFTEHYRDSMDYPKPIQNTIKEVILIKYTDPAERELVRIRCCDTFGVNL